MLFACYFIVHFHFAEFYHYSLYPTHIASCMIGSALHCGMWHVACGMLFQLATTVCVWV